MKMTTVEIRNGESIVFDLSKFKTYYLSKLVKSEEVVVEKARPSYPSELEATKKFIINHNYDGMIGTVTYDPDTKTIRGSGYGWESMFYNLE